MREFPWLVLVAMTSQGPKKKREEVPGKRSCVKEAETGGSPLKTEGLPGASRGQGAVTQRPLPCRHPLQPGKASLHPRPLN